MSVFGVILARIFPHSDWIWRDKSECKKMTNRITPNTDTFYEVMVFLKSSRFVCRDNEALESLLTLFDINFILFKQNISEVKIFFFNSDADTNAKFDTEMLLPIFPNGLENMDLPTKIIFKKDEKKKMLLTPWFFCFICRSGQWRDSIKTAVLKYFTIFTGKYLCWSLF